MKLRLIIATLLSVITGSIQAAVIVSTDASAPTENIAMSNVASGSISPVSAYKRGDGPAAKAVGQAFTVGSTSITMDAITWKIAGADPEVLSKPFTISIYEATLVNGSGTNTLLSLQQGVLPASGLSVGDYITFTLDQTLTLQAGKSYAVLFSFDEATSVSTPTKSLSFEMGSTYQSTNRVWAFTTGTSGITTLGADTKQTTYYIHSAAAIPEAGTYLFLVVGVVALVIFRKRCHA